MNAILKQYFIMVMMVGLVCTSFTLVEAKRPSSCPGSDGNGKNGGVYQYLTPEMQAKCDTIVKEFAKKTQELREKILAKRLELQAIAQSNKPDRTVIQELSREIAKMHTELASEYEKMYEKLSSEVGIRGHYIHGSGLMHRHGMGYGMGGYNTMDHEPGHGGSATPVKNGKGK